MSKYLSWYCMDAALARDPRVDNLPDNDYRWAWVCLLGLEKGDELDGQDVVLFAKHCNISQTKMIKVLDWFREVGLVGKDNRPNDFDGWQKRALSRERTRRSRARNATVTPPSRTSNAPVTTHTHTETDSKIKAVGKPTRPIIIERAKAVLEHLVIVTGVKYRKWENIAACLNREGCSVVDCMLVIDYKWAEAKGDPDSQKWVNATTPWRPRNFSDILDMAQASRSKQGLVEKHSGVY